MKLPMVWIVEHDCKALRLNRRDLLTVFRFTFRCRRVGVAFSQGTSLLAAGLFLDPTPRFACLAPSFSVSMFNHQDLRCSAY